MVSRKSHVCCAWSTGAYIETAVRDRPLRTLMVSRRCHACCVWTTGPYRDRGERQPHAHHLWCRESATLAVPGRPCAYVLGV
eukprot:6320974-Pyramimonas_sp.AAC.1